MLQNGFKISKTLSTPRSVFAPRSTSTSRSASTHVTWHTHDDEVTSFSTNNKEQFTWGLTKLVYIDNIQYQNENLKGKISMGLSNNFQGLNFPATITEVYSSGKYMDIQLIW